MNSDEEMQNLLRKTEDTFSFLYEFKDQLQMKSLSMQTDQVRPIMKNLLLDYTLLDDTVLILCSSVILRCGLFGTRVNPEHSLLQIFADIGSSVSQMIEGRDESGEELLTAPVSANFHHFQLQQIRQIRPILLNS